MQESEHLLSQAGPTSGGTDSDIISVLEQAVQPTDSTQTSTSVQRPRDLSNASANLIHKDNETECSTTPLLHTSSLSISPRTSYTRIGIWWWESTCCSIVLLAFVALVSTLKAYDGHAIPDFPSGMTFNTVISIYAVIIKSAGGLVAAEALSHLKWTWAVKDFKSLSDIVVHDDASRGPLGALQLLFHFRWKNPRSSLGAAVILMLLALDPFTQQIVRQISCVKNVDGLEASISRTRFIDAGRSQSRNRSTSIDHGYKGSIYKVLLGGSLEQDLFSCSTGNCTFEEFSTLAWTSSCSDISDKLIESEIPLIGSFNQSLYYPKLPTSNNVTLPICEKWGGSNVTLQRSLTHTGVFAAEACHLGLSWISWTDQPRGYHCSLHPCIRNIRARVDAGKLHETIESQFNLVDTSRHWSQKGTFSYVDLQTLPLLGQQRVGLKTLGYKFDDTTHFVPYNLSFMAGRQPPFNYTDFRLEENPCPDHLVSLTTAQQLNDTEEFCYERRPHNTSFPSNYWLTLKAYNLLTSANLYQAYTWPLMEMFNGYTKNESKVDDDIPYATFRSAATSLVNAQAFMDNIADAMNTYSRIHGDTNLSAPAPGKVLKETTCLRVAWPWLIYSTVIVLLLAGFLALTIWHSHETQRVLQKSCGREGNSAFDFKSSALELMFHGLDKDTLEQHSCGVDGNKTRVLSKKADTMVVRLVPTTDGLKLSSKMN
ncbi:hypothetical protein C7974DRAFT_475168 [Boeremia exigua]|uniref:uncharacterized protein n=1 Tax=Boeremia exigua TaxID=749465 RepID=UPI001E8D7CF2|nr:uncharacterized protein C7974DRAFT_475168 [Boeremia exigua]KAH6616770.1 hypothetical protein C7974DRAFT_475168 [Boeremia exigua]